MMKIQIITAQVSMVFDDGKDPVEDSDAIFKPHETLFDLRDYVRDEVHEGNFVVTDSRIEKPVKVADEAKLCKSCMMWDPEHQFKCPNGPTESTRFGPLEGKMRDVAELREGDIVTVDDGSPMMLIMRCYINENINAMACDVDDNRMIDGEHVGPYRKNFTLGTKVLVLRAKGI